MLPPLSGLNVIEIESIGPAPFAGRFLVELGATVTVITRPGSPAFSGANADNIISRGKETVQLNLKSDEGRDQIKAMIAQTDILIEGMRPGVMEKLGLGPDDLAPLKPALVYGRITGWGQDGPLSHAAGHDLNYAALSGALWYNGQPGEPPLSTPTLLGDIGGGALYLLIGIISAAMAAKQTGQGRVVDAAMVDGSAHMMNLILTLQAMNMIKEERGKSLLDSPHWYGTFECADGKYVSIGALEPQFYVLLLDKLGLSDDPEFKSGQLKMPAWPELKSKMATLIKTKTQKDWVDLLEGTDACFAPVLSPWQSADHPHMTARNIWQEDKNGIYASPAPRFKPLSASAKNAK